MAIAGGPTKPDALINAIAERQVKLSSLDAQIRNLKTAPQSIMAEIQRLERLALSRLADFRKVLRGSDDVIRAFLTNLFEGPLKFRADGEYFLIEGEVSGTSAFFCGVPKAASLHGRI